MVFAVTAPSAERHPPKFANDLYPKEVLARKLFLVNELVRTGHLEGALVPPPHVVILNGAGSVGKSSTARALQTITAEPFLHVAMDVFVDMLPEGMFGHPAGLLFERTQAQGKPTVIIRTGPVIERAMRGMRHAIAAMAAQGNHLIVDEVMIGHEKERDYRRLLAAFDIRFVGLFAPLNVLEARERERGDREIGLARWQYDRVHRHRIYDLKIETTTISPMEAAKGIRDVFNL